MNRYPTPPATPRVTGTIPSDNTVRGFSLIELLVTVTIIAILAAVAIPVFANQREKAALTVAVQDGQQLAKNVSAELQTTNVTTGSSGTTIVGTGTPVTSITLNYGVGATPATSVIPVRTSTGTTVSGSIAPNATTPQNYCIKLVNNGQTAIYTERGLQTTAVDCLNGTTSSTSVASNLLASSGLVVWNPNQTVTVSNDNGWKRVDTVQTTSSPGVFVATPVPVTPNTNYTYSIDAYKTAPGAALLYVDSTSGVAIIFAGTIPTTSSRVSITFNSGANTAIRLAVLWAPPGGAGSSMWLKDPALTIS